MWRYFAIDAPRPRCTVGTLEPSHLRSQSSTSKLQASPSSDAAPASASGAGLRALALEVNLHCQGSAVPVPRLVCQSKVVWLERNGELPTFY